MARVIVITDKEGRVVGSVRADPFETENGLIQARVPSTIESTPSAMETSATRAGGDFRYQEVEIADEYLERPVEELHNELGHMLRNY
jgi:hypothetical protein